MPKTTVVFQAAEEFGRTRAVLDRAGAAYRAVEPPEPVAAVGVPFLVIPDASRGALYEAVCGGVMLAGQAPYRDPAPDALADLPPAPADAEDVAGRFAISFMGPCVATENAIRLTAQVAGDLGPVLPYLNADLPAAAYAPGRPSLTLMDDDRLVCLYPHRITAARCHEMLDAWRTLEAVRRLVLDVWSRRETIEPSEARTAPPSVLEIYQQTPRINCGACGEPTCMAFAVKLLAGKQEVTHCTPAFEGDHPHRRQGLLEIAERLGR